MDHWSELEFLRRSIAMSPPKSAALDREEAMRVLAELQELGAKLKALRDALRSVMDDE